MTRGGRSRIVFAALTVALGTGAVLAGKWTLSHPRSAAAASPPGALAPGHQRRWALEADVRLDQPAAEPLSIQLAGTWLVTVSDVHADGFDAACELQAPRVTGSGVKAIESAQVGAMARRLARRFWITYRSDGAALTYHFPSDVEPGDRNLLLTLVTGTQLVRPAGSGAGWTALERDGVGTYLAAYQRPETDVVLKEKVKYLDGRGGSGPVELPVQVTASRQRFSLDATGEVSALDGEEHLRVGLGKAGGIAVRTSLRLTQGRSAEAPDVAGSLGHAGAALEHGPIRTFDLDPAQVRAQSDRRLLAGITSEELLAGAARGVDPATSRRLEALLRQRPEVIPRVEAAARRDRAAAMLLPALAAAGTPAAVAALGRLLGEATIAPAIRVQALTALTRSVQPTIEAMSLPLRLLDDRDAAVRGAAQLVGGAMAQAGRAQHPEAAEMFDRALAARLAQATDPVERVALLSAAGNSGGRLLAPIVAKELRDSSAEVRAAAARALRLLPLASAEDLLVEAMANDQDLRVRAAAVSAAGPRAGSRLLAALVRAATQDRAEIVRGAAVAQLAARQDGAPEVSTTLAQIAEGDPSERVRQSAREAAARRLAAGL
jgi:HEAT repeat protein